jgi:type IV pilus assembly protein PilA
LLFALTNADPSAAAEPKSGGVLGSKSFRRDTALEIRRMKEMRKLHTRNGGFTLIELMIVVAIIGILAAIAIPNFLRFQLRSRVGEGKTNIAAIRTAEESYAAEYATYVGAAPLPMTGLSGDKQNWPAGVAGDGFSTIGWFPEGEVYYDYNVTVSPAACPAPMTPCTLYTVEGNSDIDNDGMLNTWGYVHAPPGATVGIAGVTAAAAPSGPCPATGVYNGVTLANDLLNTTGPCNPVDGQSIF